MTVTRRPRGILLDYGGTLVVEAGYDPVAGNRAMLARVSHSRPALTLDEVNARAARVTNDIAARRDTFGIEAPWKSLIRLIYDGFGARFSCSLEELEIAFWDASVTTHGMPGAKEALATFHADGVPTAVLSNAMFAAPVIRHDLDKHGLAEHLAFVMVTADYVVRKPNPLLFDVGAARMGLSPGEIWFVGDRLDTDIAGAKAAGMVTVWFNSANSAPSDAPDITVRDWAELRQCFEETVA